MNILYIDHYAGSPGLGMEYRPYYLAQQWTKAGHRVRIVAASYSHLRRIQPNTPEHAKSSASWLSLVEGVEFQWLRSSHYHGNGRQRFINIISFLFNLGRLGSSISDEFKPDIVIASSTYPLDIYPASRIAKKQDAVLAFEVHDLWPLTLTALNDMSTLHPFVRICAAAEKFAYSRADLVLSLLPNAISHAVSRGTKPENFFVTPNCVSVQEWTSDSKSPLDDTLMAEMTKATEGASLRVGYAGSHGVSNALDSLLDAAVILRDTKVTFVLFGHGPDKIRLENRIERERLINVHMFPSVPKNTIPALLGEFDIGFLGAPRSELYKFGVSPNKMIDYMMAGLPILFSIDAGNDPISEANCGISVRSGKSHDIATAIKKFESMASKERKTLGNNGKKYALERHTYESLSKNILELFMRHRSVRHKV